MMMMRQEAGRQAPYVRQMPRLRAARVGQLESVILRSPVHGWLWP